MDKMMRHVDNIASKLQEEVIQLMLDIAHRPSHYKVGSK
jgi:hypothetical protein